MAISEEDADFATVAAALAAGTPLDPEDIEPDPERRHGLDRRDRAALLAWMALSHTGALAPGADVAATSLAWYDELRLPVGARRRAPRHRVRRGRGLGRHRPGPGPARAAPAVGDARVGAGRGGAPARRVAGARDDQGGDRPQHLGGRRVPRPRSLPRPARPGPSASTRSTLPTSRPPARAHGSRPVWPKPPRPAGYRVDATRAALAVAAGSASRGADRDGRHAAAAPVLALAPSRLTRAGSAAGARSAARRGRSPIRGAAGS